MHIVPKSQQFSMQTLTTLDSLVISDVSKFVNDITKIPKTFSRT